MSVKNARRTQRSQRAQRTERVGTRFLVSLVSLVLMQCAACARSPESSGQRGRIAVGVQNQLIYLPTTLARELWFYREEGLEVELQDHAGGSKALQAMVGGSADVVSGFYDHTIQMAAEGRELVAFVTILRYPGLVLVTSPKTSVSKIEDLKGKVAGVTTPGSSSHMLLTFLLHRHGVEADAVSVTGIGGPGTARGPVARRTVHAGLMSGPALTNRQPRPAGRGRRAGRRAAGGGQ